MRIRRAAFSVVLVLMISLVGARAQDSVAGNAGVGDDLFPNAGNGGYDVQHYTLDITWHEADNTIDATATIEAQAALPLSRFNLDLLGFNITSITVNKKRATYTRAESELTITPQIPLVAGDIFTTVIVYSGTPSALPEGGLPVGEGYGVGWNAFAGGVFTASQVIGAHGWYPVNDHPLDAATYTLRVTVPKPYSVASNGTLEETIENDGETQTFVWKASDPVASYLVTVNIAEFRVVESTGENGLPIINYFPASYSDAQLAPFEKQADMIAFYSDVFGPYPFSSAGAIVVDVPLSIALETQTRPLYGSSFDEATIAHEIAHQWFGDSVRLADWQDLWLNEGFASYAEILWTEHAQGQEAMEALVRQNYGMGVHEVLWTFSRLEVLTYFFSLFGLDDRPLTAEQVEAAVHALLGETVDQAALDKALKDLPAKGLPSNQIFTVFQALPFDRLILTGPGLIAFVKAVDQPEALEFLGLPEEFLRSQPPGVATQETLFNLGVYYRGASALHALRLRVGDELFFSILHTYYARYAGQAVTIPDFIAVAEEVSNQQLDDFFEAWLYAETAPDIPELGLYANDPLSSLGDATDE